MIALAQTDEEQGDEILDRSFAEFNDMSLIDRMNTDQRDWLAWSDAPSSDPDESWMFTGTSSITRNKIISTAAHLTAQVIYPNIFAQNEEDEEDEAAGYVMRQAIEYNCRRSNYEQTFLYAVIAGLVNPVSYYKVDYATAYQDVLEGTQSDYKRRQVIDEVLSGFQDNLLPADEVLLANPYCFDIQKQPFVIERKRISFTEARSLYGTHPDFDNISPGLVAILNAADGLFYAAQDQNDDGLVQLAIFKYRGRDVEFPIVNGIYLGNPNTDYNPMGHRRVRKDGTTVPVLNIVKYGAEPIDAQRFFAYKSLASKLANDKELIDRMRQNAVDASTFATFPSIFTMGAGKMDRSVFIPATTVDLPKDAKVNPATGMANPSYAYNAAREAEQAVNESSMDPQTSGVGGGNSKTARESVILQQNAIQNLGIMGRMIATMVKDVGELKVDDVIRYQSVGEMMELAGGTLGMKYNTMVLNDKVRDGKKQSVTIRFTDKWAGKNMSEAELRKKKVALYEEAGDSKEINEVNPALWARRQYLIVVEADALKPKNSAFDRAIDLQTYDRAINNPLVANDPEKLAEVTRDFLFENARKGEGAKYIPKDVAKVMNKIVPTPGSKEGVAGRLVEQEAMDSLPVTA